MRALLAWGWVVVCLAGLGTGCASEADAGDAPVWPVTARAAVTAAGVDPPAYCDRTDDPMQDARISRPSTFWSANPELRATLVTVLARWSKATGLDLSVAGGGIEVVRVDLPADFGGFAFGHIQIDSSLTGPAIELTLLHEVGHLLGAGHLGPWEGVMSRCQSASSSLLTEADLMQVCSAAPCTTFQQEL